jgi:ankyrin repeat protein
VTKLLLKLGANIKDKEKCRDNYSALHYAVHHSSNQTSMFLLTNEADFLNYDKNGKTPYDLAL